MSSFSNEVVIVNQQDPQRRLELRDGLVMGHISPDSDSLCGSISFARMLRRHGKEAWVFIPGHAPKYLDWLIAENADIVVSPSNYGSERFASETDFLYVLDCDATPERTGFPINPNKHKIFNIDHHWSHFEDVLHDAELAHLDLEITHPEAGTWMRGQKNNVEYYLEYSGSVCEILATTFGLSDDILVLGIYHDTMSLAKNGVTSARAIAKLNITDERMEYMIGACAFKGNKDSWKNMTNIPTWFDDTSFICFAYDPTNTLDSFHAIKLLAHCAKVVVYINKNGSVSIRTHLKDIDLSSIAHRFGGGGHRRAAGFYLGNHSLESVANAIYQEYNLQSSSNMSIELYSFDLNLKKFMKA